MTSLFDAYHHIKQLMDEHGGNSPCYYRIWSVGDIQTYGREEWEQDWKEYKRNPSAFDGPPSKEFLPYTSNQLKHIANHMMEHSTAFIKDHIAYNEAHYDMPEE